MEVVSWHGRSIRNFRGHGVGMEDVLTTEVFQALDLLPRDHFLGPVLEACEGSANDARRLLVEEAEALRVEAHADRFHLVPSEKSHQAAIAIDPDVVLETPEVLAFIEAKRLAASAAFQREQLARQYFALTREAGSRKCCLILVLGSAPPIRVDGMRGRLEPRQAILESLPAVYARAGTHPESLETLQEAVENRILWTTWQRIEDVVSRALKDFKSGSRSIDASVDRAASAILGCVTRHTV